MHHMIVSSLIHNVNEGEAVEIRTNDGSTYAWGKPKIWSYDHTCIGVILKMDGQTTVIAAESIAVINVVHDTAKIYGRRIPDSSGPG